MNNLRQRLRKWSMGPRTKGWLTVAVIALLLSVLSVPRTLGESSPPTTPVPAAPVLTVTKDSGTNSVIFSWTAPGGTSPFALSRSQNPDFAVGPAVPLQGGISGMTAMDTGVLNDGNSYFYNVDDIYDGPKVFGLSANQGLPGAVITATGVNIDPTASANTVYINEVAAVPSTSTTTTVQFTLPDGTVRYCQELCSRFPAQAACFLIPFSNSTPSMTSASSFAPFNTLHRF